MRRPSRYVSLIDSANHQTAVTIGNLGGLISAWTFTGSEAPSFYRRGQIVNLTGTIFVRGAMSLDADPAGLRHDPRDLGLLPVRCSCML